MNTVEYQGQRYHHIIDPRSGYPAGGFISVTVIYPDSATADTAFTALLHLLPALMTAAIIFGIISGFIARLNYIHGFNPLRQPLAS